MRPDVSLNNYNIVRNFFCNNTTSGENMRAPRTWPRFERIQSIVLVLASEESRCR